MGAMMRSRAKLIKTPEHTCPAVAGGQGFEPRLTDPKSVVLPLDDPPLVVNSLLFVMYTIILRSEHLSSLLLLFSINKYKINLDKTPISQYNRY